MARLARRSLALFGLAFAILMVGAASALAQANEHLDPSQFELSTFTTSTSDMTAGAHPDVGTLFEFKSAPAGSGDRPLPYGRARRVEVDLPPGLVGNPTNFPECRLSNFHDPTFVCPAATQIGVADISVALTGGHPGVPIYNLERGPDEPALFGIKLTLDIYVYIRVAVKPNGDLVAYTDDMPPGHPLMVNDMTIWGVPADHSGSGEERLPFMSSGTECQTVPKTTLRAFAWDVESKPQTGVSLLDGPLEDCAGVPFDPSMTLSASTRAAGAPTGLDVTIDVPQRNDPDGRATAHVRDVELVLPEGMTVSPSSAHGLGACLPGQIALDTPGRGSCPDSSKLGTVTVETPVLEEPMVGAIYLASQRNNPFGSLLALYVEISGAGQTVKLAGRVDPDPQTGRLTTTFRDNPQLPFSRMTVKLKSGPRAPLVTPQACGSYASQVRFVGWNEKEVPSSVPMTIDQGCHARGFEPAFESGSVDPAGGAYSPLVTRVTRSGVNQRELGRIDVTLPKGTLASLRDVGVCRDSALATATLAKPGRSTQADPACPRDSQVGTVTVGAGAGPLYYPQLPGTDVSGRVFLTKEHTGTDAPIANGRQASYGLAFEVPAVAGPFDLGTVLVRAAIYVDPATAQVRVVSDRLPRILDGIPLDVRDVVVDIDRPQFALNPSSCEEKRIEALIGAQDGATAARAARFQASDCARLAFKPRLGMRLVGRKQRTTGKHPAVRAVVRQSGLGEAGIRRARVVLPASLALDPDNAQALCEFEDGTKPDLENHCPEGSKVGRARAKTPLLKRDLVGDVFFVKNVRRDPSTGNLIRTLPMIVVALRGEIAVNLVGKSDTTKAGRLVNTFAGVPDAPITRFNLNIKGGQNGILAVTGTRRGNIDLCARPRGHLAATAWRAQNGKRADYPIRVKTPCGKSARRTARMKRQAAKRRG